MQPAVRLSPQDMLKHLGHRLALLLPCLLALIVSLLEAACAPLQAQVSCLALHHGRRFH